MPLHYLCRALNRCLPAKALSRDLVQVGISFLFSLVLPVVLYFALDELFGIDVTGYIYLIVISFLLLVALSILLECICAGRHKGTPEKAGAPEPYASAIICAYMPNEQETIMETVMACLSVDYEPGVQVILAYNTPHHCPVEDELGALCDEYPNLFLLKVENSRSKAQNLNAALEFVQGEFVACFDADHCPDPDSFSRAWRWLSNGYDIVQGHCLVRNAEETFIAKMVACEFESIYAVAHPGRYVKDGFGLFGGSNGYWMTHLLQEIGMRGEMLTEDIDSSMRALEAGFKIASDGTLISRELTTTTLRQLWNQRLRWAQGWMQVSMKHFLPLLFCKHFGLQQRIGVVFLFLIREIYPWISSQILPLIAFWYLRGDRVSWNILVYIVISGFVASIGPWVVFMSYRLSHPLVKNKWWFIQYALFATFFYTEFKNIVARVGHIKQLMGESSWRVTPRKANAVVADTGALTLQEYAEVASVIDLDVSVVSGDMVSVDNIVGSKDYMSYDGGSKVSINLSRASASVFSGSRSVAGSRSVSAGSKGVTGDTAGVYAGGENVTRPVRRGRRRPQPMNLYLQNGYMSQSASTIGMLSIDSNDLIETAESAELKAEKELLAISDRSGRSGTNLSRDTSECSSSESDGSNDSPGDNIFKSSLFLNPYAFGSDDGYSTETSKEISLLLESQNSVSNISSFNESNGLFSIKEDLEAAESAEMQAQDELELLEGGYLPEREESFESNDCDDRERVSDNSGVETGSLSDADDNEETSDDSGDIEIGDGSEMSASDNSSEGSDDIFKSSLFLNPYNSELSYDETLDQVDETETMEIVFDGDTEYANEAGGLHSESVQVSNVEERGIYDESDRYSDRSTDSDSVQASKASF